MIRPLPVWLRLLLPRNVLAITLGRHIFAARELSPAEMRHELVHVRQMGELGMLVFVARYLEEYLANRFRRMGHDAAYRAISFEKEAFAAEDEQPGAGSGSGAGAGPLE